MSEVEKRPDQEVQPVLVMYDVRGIQNYIYKTSKVKDARGASAIVNDIIQEALREALRDEDITSDVSWFDESGVIEIAGQKDFKDVQVLFIGGGNATVLFKSKALCQKVNRKMSKYVLDHTYSLQLAISMTEKTDSYKNDYRRLNEAMVKTKAQMSDTRPLGTLPVMKMELKTGYPLEKEMTINGKREELSLESCLKKKKADRLNDKAEKRFDAYVKSKGTDSHLAIVHIDGNNMGMRIRSLIENETDYISAVNKIRHISYNINHSYQNAFDSMADYFNENSILEGKDNKNFVLKILVAGDDITYLCNANIALATVEDYCRRIASCTMNQGLENDCSADESVKKYGFSVCAGIAYYTGHFPFSVAYDVAEQCCDSAKKYAKENTDGDRVANYLDFQICKNVQARNLKRIRSREYRTATGEQLLIRPYYVSLETQAGYAVFENKTPNDRKLKKLKENIRYFQDEKKIPRSFAKELRNTYADGQQPVEVLADFLKSRSHKMPDGTFQMYDSSEGKMTAKWYDALELMDYFEEVEVDGEI